jgi:hypothetical protein
VGLLLALGAGLPLLVHHLRERRGRQVRRALGLDDPPRRAGAPVVIALVAVPVLLGLAAAQPVVDLAREGVEREDAEVFVVLDTSRSMLAAARPDGETRFDRARALTLRLASELPEVPVGLASMTDRVLPHLFPSSDPVLFAAVLERSLGIERPPPVFTISQRATHLGGLATLVTGRYFSDSAQKRVVVVISDGEVREAVVGVGREYSRPPGVSAVWVTTWDDGERVYLGGAQEEYRPDELGPRTMARLAEETRGRLVEGEDGAALVTAVREAVGEGPTRTTVRSGERIELMPYVTAAALLPLVFVLLRRNL